MDLSETTIPPGRYSASVNDLIFIAALGPMRIVEQLKPSYGPRYRKWIDDLQSQYLDHALRDGRAKALRWLMAQISDPKLPDLRRGKSASDDVELLQRVRRLTKALAPVFRETKGNRETRAKRIEPIVSEVLESRWDQTDTVTGKEPLMRFCYGVLGASAARVSQARGRVNRASYQKLEQAIVGMELTLTALRAAGRDDAELRALVVVGRHFRRKFGTKLHTPSKKKSPRAKK